MAYHKAARKLVLPVLGNPINRKLWGGELLIRHHLHYRAASQIARFRVSLHFPRVAPVALPALEARSKSNHQANPERRNPFSNSGSVLDGPQSDEILSLEDGHQMRFSSHPAPPSRTHPPLPCLWQPQKNHTS